MMTPTVLAAFGRRVIPHRKGHAMNEMATLDKPMIEDTRFGENTVIDFDGPDGPDGPDGTCMCWCTCAPADTRAAASKATGSNVALGAAPPI